MEPTLYHSNFVVELLIILSPDPKIMSIIDEVFRRFNFSNESGLLQFWACSSTPSNSEDSGFNLTLSNQPYVSTGDHIALEDHRRRCFVKNRFVGLETSVGNWFAGRAAQTRIADNRTRHFVLSQDPHDAEAVGKGQLVLPVFYGQGAGKKLAGIIELVTVIPKESYSEDFEQLCQLLQGYGLHSSYMGQTIKVEYNNNWIKFPLPYSARLTDLHTEVTVRFEELKQRTFCLNYKDTNGNCCRISSDADLRRLMAESNLKGETVVRMHVR